MKTLKDKSRLPLNLTGTRYLTGLILLFVLSGILFTTESCTKSEDPNVIFQDTERSSETSANASTATGTATLTYNKNTKIFTIVVYFNGVTATIGHIHKGAVGVSGDPVFGFTPPITSPITYTTVALDPHRKLILCKPVLRDIHRLPTLEEK
jgi:hypothetical protein